MSGQYLFSTSKSLDQDAITWTNQTSTPTSLHVNVTSSSITDSLNESYATAIEDNDTAYLSVLETTNETTLEALHNLTLENSKIITHENLEPNTENGIETININLDDAGENVVLFKVDGTDDLYGVQLVQDDEGNIQKYQFQFRTTEQGTLEAIPETIQLLPNDDEIPEQLELLEQEVTEPTNSQNELNNVEEEANTIDQIEENQIEHDFNVFVKNESVQNNYFEETEEEEEPTAQHTEITIDIKPGILELTEPSASIATIKSEMFNEDSQEFHDHRINEETLVEDDGMTVDNEGCENVPIQSDEIMVENQNYVSDQVDNQQYEPEQGENQHYVPDQEDNEFSEASESDSQAEIPNCSRLFIEERFIDEAVTENLKQDAILHDSDVDNNEPESDNEEYDIADGMHVTADGELIEQFQVPLEQQDHISSNAFQQLLQQNSNVLKLPSKEPKKGQKKLLYYLMPHPEKENLNAVPLNTYVDALNGYVKPNPRSVLKPQAVLKPQTALELKFVANPNSMTVQNVKDEEVVKRLEKIEKRFLKSKEAVQARMFNNFINKTTIPHAPVRQKRLPRKQQIKPVDTRIEEEIIVQEVMVSSKGFIESVEDRMKARDKLEVVSYIELVDSDDESSKTSKKALHANKEGVIEIFSSDEEDEQLQQKNHTPKKGRGRPKKHLVTANNLKRDREKQISDNGSQDESSPSKKSRTESSENDSDNGKKEVICPHCPKTFASQNSLTTHIQHHNLENRLRNNRMARMSTFEFKHKCVDCETTFKNAILLKRHVCEKKKSQYQCEVCKRGFRSLLLLNNHKKFHNTNETVLTEHNPQEMNKTKAFESLPEIKKYSCDKCKSSFKNAILLKRHVCQEKTGKFKCGMCKMSFDDVTMFNIHKRKHIKQSLMKTTVTEDQQITPKKSLTSIKNVNLPKLNSLPGTPPSKGALSFKVMKKFTCKSCNTKFTSRLLLEMHTRRNCVKTPTKNISRLLKKEAGESSVISTPLDLNAQCDICSKKFRMYSGLLQHKIKEHNYSPPAKDSITKPKKKPVNQYKDHGGVPPNPRLRKVFHELRTKLQNFTPKKPVANEISNIND